MILIFDLVMAYLVGAFPSSIVLGKALRGVDIRRAGSGNAGATNAWRVLGWRMGLAVLALDVGKGVLAAAVVPRLEAEGLPISLAAASILCGLAAVIGHVFPVYVGFRGGKGVATAAGMLLAVAPIPVSIALGVFVLSATTTGWVSLGSILAAWTVPAAAALLPPSHDGISHPLLLGLAAALALLVTATHRVNLRRLVRGEEARIPALQFWRRRTQRSPGPRARDDAGNRHQNGL